MAPIDRRLFSIAQRHAREADRKAKGLMPILTPMKGGVADDINKVVLADHKVTRDERRAVLRLFSDGFEFGSDAQKKLEKALNITSCDINEAQRGRELWYRNPDDKLPTDVMPFKRMRPGESFVGRTKSPDDPPVTVWFDGKEYWRGDKPGGDSREVISAGEAAIDWALFGYPASTLPK